MTPHPPTSLYKLNQAHKRSINTIFYLKKSSSQAIIMPSAHPFLVDQRPYLPRSGSSSSVSSSSSSTSTYTFTSSGSSIYSTSSSSTTSTPTYTPTHSRQNSVSSEEGGVDSTCLRFMRETSDSLHCFGSVSSRSSSLSSEERRIRREVEEEMAKRVGEAEFGEGKKDKRRRFGRIF